MQRPVKTVCSRRSCSRNLGRNGNRADQTGRDGEGRNCGCNLERTGIASAIRWSRREGRRPVAVRCGSVCRFAVRIECAGAKAQAFRDNDSALKGRLPRVKVVPVPWRRAEVRLPQIRTKNFKIQMEMNTQDEKFMRRALELAREGVGLLHQIRRWEPSCRSQGKDSWQRLPHL